MRRNACVRSLSCIIIDAYPSNRCFWFWYNVLAACDVAVLRRSGTGSGRLIHSVGSYFYVARVNEVSLSVSQICGWRDVSGDDNGIRYCLNSSIGRFSDLQDLNYILIRRLSWVGHWQTQSQVLP